MIAKMIEGHIRLLGRDQGYLALPVRDEQIETKQLKDGAYTSKNCMVTSWEPTPEELWLLNEGGHVRIRILGTVHPPIGVGVQ